MRLLKLFFVFLLIIVSISISSCSGSATVEGSTISHSKTEMSEIQTTQTSLESLTETSTPTSVVTPEESKVVEEVVEENIIPSPQPTPIGEAYLLLPDSAEWELWPELPVLSAEAIEIFNTGIASGTDPHAVSIFGDCQSLPDAFWGRYDDPEYVLTDEESQYRSSIEWFSGSFDRESVTVRKGTTAAAILWAGWLDGQDHDCEYGETPLACELRLHNPSIVIISVGTHWELRNDQYLRKMIEELLAQGVLPVISTKADQREGEAWVNEEMVSIAHEYKLPVWNFWSAVQPLENHGMIEGDAMYMNDSGLDMQRISGLRVLDAILSQLDGAN